MTRAELEAEAPWKGEDLAERWGIPKAEVWRIVEELEVPHFYIGRGTPTKGRSGPKARMRFRPAAVIAWEKARERVYEKGKEDAPAPAPPSIAEMLGGEPIGRRKGRSGPRKAATTK